MMQGAHDYVVGSLPAATRAWSSLASAATGKSIRTLRLVAERA